MKGHLVKITHSNSIAAATALVLLAACGQDAATEAGASSDDSEMVAPGAAADRDWIPAGIVLPEPHTVLQDTRLGTRTYLQRGSVPTDPSGQFPAWKSALETAGYEVNEGLLHDGRLLFDRADVESGQISVSQPEDIEGYMIQIDVSKETQ